jgi:hypothetical protein
MKTNKTTSKHKFLLMTLLVLCISSSCMAQFGTKYLYEFLSLPASARMTALGGGTHQYDDDITLAYYNPALLNAKMHKSIQFNHNFHFADVSNGNFGLGFNWKNSPFTMHAGLAYVNYAQSIRTDEFNTNLGQFTSADRAIVLGAGRKINERIHVGLNIKGIISSYESYKSMGLATDLSLNYHADSSLTTIAFVVHNLGRELSSYTTGHGVAPLNIEIALTRRLPHLPLTFTIAAHQLQQWNIRYDDPDQEAIVNIIGQEENDQSQFSKNLDNVFRHLLFNAELAIGKNGGFKLRGGYNHFRRKELSLSTIRSLSGFNMGFGLKVKMFNIDYGIGYHHLAGATNHLSIGTNLDRFTKTKAHYNP